MFRLVCCVRVEYVVFCVYASPRVIGIVIWLMMLKYVYIEIVLTVVCATVVVVVYVLFCVDVFV